MAVCRYHPDRLGIGICMRCRAVICAACCTRMDGVNHCHACLRELGQRTAKDRSSGLTTGALAVLVLGAAWLVFFGIGWLLQGRLAP